MFPVGEDLCPISQSGHGSSSECDPCSYLEIGGCRALFSPVPCVSSPLRTVPLHLQVQSPRNSPNGVNNLRTCMSQTELEDFDAGREPGGGAY